MAAIGSPAQNGKAYKYVDHSFDVIVVGAGGAGLRAGGLEGLGGQQAEGAERAGAEKFTTIHGDGGAGNGGCD